MTGFSTDLPLLAVIGGGASGMVASISAARQASALGKKLQIVIFESNRRVGKKLLVTGNGRCNLSNLHISPQNYSGSRELFRNVYGKFDRCAALGFFESLGVLTVSDADGRIYPMSMKASSVLDALMYECSRLGIETLAETPVTSLRAVSGGVVLNGSVTARAAVAACGGLAGGGDARSYALFSDAGVRVTPLAPGLTAFTVRSHPKSLKGVRAEGKMTLYVDNKEISNETGEIQYTEYGLSGYPSMQLSSRMPACRPNADTAIVIDSLCEISFRELRNRYEKHRAYAPDMPAVLFLSGMLPKPLAAVFIKDAGLDADCTLGSMDDKTAERLFDQCKRKRYEVQGLRGFSQAQVTRGGIDAREIGENLALKKLPGVYVCGEIVDVAGECGGYNLQWAWSSGYIAGKNCVSENF